jgi:N-acetylmuramoyl-L-alanine amidase
MSLQLGVRAGSAVIAAGVLVLLGGCGGDKRKAQTPNPELKQYVREELPPATPVYSAQPDYSSGGRTIRGPRSQSEIAAMRQIPVQAAPLRVSTPEPRPVAAMPDSGPVTADPDWVVPITRDWRHIVVHHSASASGSASAFDKAHRDRGWDGLGYHFVIGNGSLSGDGEVEVGYRWKRQMQGAHAGNAEYNQAGVGICLVGDFQNGGRPSAAQMASLRRLTRFLQVKCGVPTYEVIGHQNVPGKSTECPGQYLSMADFRASLGNGAVGDYQVATKKSSGTSKVAQRPTGGGGTRSGAALP